MERQVALSKIKKGQKGRVEHLETAGSIRRRLQDLGITPGTWVECVGVSPMGDPAAYLVRGTVIALRRQDAEHIQVRAGEQEAPWD